MGAGVRTKTNGQSCWLRCANCGYGGTTTVPFSSVSRCVCAGAVVCNGVCSPSRHQYSFFIQIQEIHTLNSYVTLFLPSQAATHTMISKVGELCDARFCQLELEPGGKELMSFFTSPGDAAQLQNNIMRQDHPEVRRCGTLYLK